MRKLFNALKELKKFYSSDEYKKASCEATMQMYSYPCGYIY